MYLSLIYYLEDELNEFSIPFEKNIIIGLIKLCVVDCEFEFEGKYYSQRQGMAMENPLSPLLSNLHMEFF